MSHEIVVTDAARRDIELAASWWAEHRSLRQALRWSRRLQAKIATLSEHPERLSLAHESARFSFDLQELLFGTGRRMTHRILFRIVGESVQVLAVRHMSRSDLGPGDFD